MADTKKIKTALVSVFSKENLDKIIHKLNDLNVKILSTGGTQSFIESLGIRVILLYWAAVLKPFIRKFLGGFFPAAIIKEMLAS